jgi:hypothetical protein
MTTAKQIFNEIQGVNPSSSTISSVGTFVSSISEQIAGEKLNEVIKNLPNGSLAYKIAYNTTGRFTEKQLWVIAFELLKNAEYCKSLEEKNQALKDAEARKHANNVVAKSRKQEQKKEASDNLEANSGLTGNVRHNRFGEGVVISETEDMITVNFVEYGEKTMMKKFTVLEKI